VKSKLILFLLIMIVCTAMIPAVAAAKYGIVIVHVTYPDGNPAGGAKVSIDGVSKGTTNSMGELHISTVNPGNRQISACKQKYLNNWYRGSRSVNVIAGKSNNVYISMKNGYIPC